MNIPNFKDILKKFSIFKNNLSLMMSVIIALVSILLFIITYFMSSNLRKTVQNESIRRAGSDIRILNERAVSLNQWEMEAERQRHHAEDANTIVLLAEQSTKRDLLSYDIFPEPNSSSTLIFQEFGKRFRSGIDQLIANVNGKDRPTDAELQRGLEDSVTRTRGRGGQYPMESSGTSSIRSSSVPSMRPSGISSMGYPGMSTMGDMGMPYMGYSGDPYGGGYGGMGNDIGNVIIDEICRERAQSASVFINPLDIAGYQFWGEYKYDVEMEEAVEDCWYFQLGYWVIEDVIDTIKAMNSNADNVLTAPVKRLMQISFDMGSLMGPGGDFMMGMGMETGMGMGMGMGGRRMGRLGGDNVVNKPSYVLAVEDGMTESCTGRYCDDDLDVIHFNVAVVVRTKDILPFIQQLCSAKEHTHNGDVFKHNQITVLETKFYPVGPQDIFHMLYSYGDDSVVELDLVCEYIFKKKGYEEIKPESVKETLIGEDET